MGKLHLNFQGYWREKSRSELPRRPGVFCVYRSQYYSSSDSLEIRELLYIGHSPSTGCSLKSSSEISLWRSALQPGEELCFSFAPAVLERSTAALALAQSLHPAFNLARTARPVPFPGRAPPPEINLSGAISRLTVCLEEIA